ncbi:MAG: tyrosine-type recombinase/integrase [Rhodopila sp.]
MRITSRHIQTMEPGQVIWDTAVIGLGARRQAGPVSYIVRYRTQEAGRQRTFTIGKHGSPWTPDSARDEARRLLGEVAKGGDPAAVKATRHQTPLTVAELCDQYLADAEAGRLLTRRRIAKRPSTLVSDRGRITRHIKPLIGHLPVTTVSRADVEVMMHAIAEGTTAGKKTKTRPRGLSVVRGGRGVASRTVGLLGAIFGYAIRKELRIDNPAHGVTRFADGRRERRLTDEEYRRLGHGLRLAEDDEMWGPAVAATRMMALTGWRRGEVLGLRWSEVDLTRRTARLAETKTGISIRPLPQMVCDLIREQARTDDLVFPTTSGAGLMVGYRKLWLRIAKLANLPADVTPHVLRHSFASLAADLGYGEPTIAGLIGTSCTRSPVGMFILRTRHCWLPPMPWRPKPRH